MKGISQENNFLSFGAFSIVEVKIKMFEIWGICCGYVFVLVFRWFVCGFV